MKKISFILLIFIVTVTSFGQTTPAAQVKIADTSTAFGINISKGSTVYFIAEQMYFAVTAPVASASTYHTARASFIQIGGAGLGGIVKSVKAANGSAITMTGTTADVIVGVATATTSTVGVASFHATDFNVETGDVTIDYANGQKATASVDGFLKKEDFTTFNNKQAALVSGTNIKTINGASILASGNLSLQTAFTAALVDYELTADSSVSCHVTLAGTPIAGSIQVTLNGAAIPYDATKTKGWAVVGNKIRVKGPVYQYEKIQVSYNY